MVRINLFDPACLADQHLIAEYNEILMLLGYVRRYPAAVGIPNSYCLGPGHIKFFKNKLVYLKQRHELLKKEMKKRSFAARITIRLSDYPRELRNDWTPGAADFLVIQKRLRDKLRAKPDYYRYFGEVKRPAFFEKLLSSQKILKELV